MVHLVRVRVRARANPNPNLNPNPYLNPNPNPTPKPNPNPNPNPTQVRETAISKTPRGITPVRPDGRPMQMTGLRVVNQPS